METLRDLIVKIDFDNVDLKTLARVDSLIDEIEDSLSDMGHEIIEAAGEFATLGEVAETALHDIQRESLIASATVDRLGDKFGWATVKATALGVAITSLLAMTVAASGPTLAAIGALGASFLAAGAGAAAFGAVAIGALAQVFETAKEIEKLEEKAANAKTSKERAAALKELASVYAGISEEQRAALQSLQSFKDFWRGFVKGFEKPVFKMFTYGLKGVQTLLTKLEPTISGVADLFGNLARSLSEKMEGYGAFKFFKWLEANAVDSLKNLMATFGNFGAGFLNLLRAFDPIMDDVEKGFLGMSEGFKKWTDGLGKNKSFQSFIEYAKVNGPVFMDVLGNLATIAGLLIKELAPIGTVVLDGFKATTGFIIDNWGAVKDTVIAAGAAVGTFIGLVKGLQIIGGIVQLVKVWRTGTLTLTAAQWAMNGALLANPLTWIVVLIAGVVAAGVALYRNWDTVKAKAIELWGALKEKFAAIKDAVMDKLQPVFDFFGRLADKWNAFKDSIMSFKMPSFGLPKWMGGNGLIQPDGSHASGLAEVKKDGYIAELHKGESVLTARQSNALRQAGVLGENAGKPTIDLSRAAAAPSKTSNVTTVAPSIAIHIHNGAGGQPLDENKIVEITKRELAALFENLAVKFGS